MRRELAARRAVRARPQDDAPLQTGGLRRCASSRWRSASRRRLFAISAWRRNWRRSTSGSTPARRSSNRSRPYLYSSYEPSCEANPTPRNKVVILGSGPNRIGQGIEFDYCCCHAAFALRDEGLETVMINCNPETVSTDYDTADRLYFQPLTFEDVMSVIETERSAGGEVSCLVQFGGQTPLKLALALQRGGRADSRHVARLDRSRRRPAAVCGAAVGAEHHAAGERNRHHRARRRGRRRTHPVSRRRAAVVRARRPRHGHRLRHRHARSLHDGRRRRLARASGAHRQVPRGCLRVRRRCRRRCDRRRRHRRHHGAHRGGGHSLGRQFMRGAAVHLPRASPRPRFATTRGASPARSTSSG